MVRVVRLRDVGERQRVGPLLGDRRVTDRLLDVVYLARFVPASRVNNGLNLALVAVDSREDACIEPKVVTAER